MVAESNVLATMTPKHAHLLPAVFLQFHLEEMWGMDKCKLYVICQVRLKLKVKFLLNADRKSYSPRPLAQQRMTLSDLESTFSASRAISAVAELVVFTCTDIVMRLWSSGIVHWEQYKVYDHVY